MDAFSELLAGLVAHPTACMLAVTLIAFAFYFKMRETERTATAKDTAAKIQALNDRNYQTAEKIIPVAEKLADGVTTLERLMTKGDH